MKLKPLYDQLLIERVEEEATTKGGILIPDAAKEKPQQGRVIAAGRGKLLEDGRFRALAVKPGDRVLFNRFAGTEFELDGEQQFIIREDEVLAVLT
jgi:chaperonin GroES